MSKERKGKEFPKELKNRIKREQNNRCAICGSKGHLEVHHIIPIVQGGGKERSNGVAVCPKCHQKLDKEAIHNHRYLTDMTEGEWYDL